MPPAFGKRSQAMFFLLSKSKILLKIKYNFLNCAKIINVYTQHISIVVQYNSYCSRDNKGMTEL